MQGYDANDNNLDHALTFDEWSSMGYWIIKGSKAACFSPDGKALFTPSQVSPPRFYPRSTTTTKRSSEFNSTPYYREHEAPPEAYMNNRLPSARSMDYFMSRMNPTHEVMRSLERHFDSVFEKHHGGDMDEQDYY